MYIVADIGGTKMRIARSDNLTKPSETVILPTPKNYEQGVKVVVQTILQMQRSAEDSIDACVIGIAGTLNSDHSEVFNSPNLLDWQKKPLRRRLENELHCHIHLENDSALAGLGEALFGAGRHYPIVAYFTISTGTGGARIVHGEVDQSATGFEPGRHIIQADKELKSLGRYISGAELEKRYGRRPEDIHDPQIWDDVARYVAYGMYNTVMFWSPHIIVLGGGLIMHKAIQLEKVNEHFMERMRHTGLDVFPHIPSLVKAELGDMGGLYGGLAYLKKYRQHFDIL